MTLADRDRLIRRIRQIRRTTAAREQQDNAVAEAADGDPLRALEQRVTHLEQLLEGLQDSVHREFGRHREMIVGLQKEIEPAALGAALAEDARSRGL